MAENVLHSVMVAATACAILYFFVWLLDVRMTGIWLYVVVALVFGLGSLYFLQLVTIKHV